MQKISTNSQKKKEEWEKYEAIQTAGAEETD